MCRKVCKRLSGMGPNSLCKTGVEAKGYYKEILEDMRA